MTRIQDLEAHFRELDTLLPEGSERQAIEVLHALLQETRRELRGVEPRTSVAESAEAFENIRNLYRSAPALEGPAIAEGLPAGAAAPDFALRDAHNKVVHLSDFKGRPVVLLFYPLDWSPACTKQLDHYQSALDEFDRYGAQLLGISVDSIYSHGAWAAVRGIDFPLLADRGPTGGVARRYKVFREHDGFSERALYVVDHEGIIRYAHIAPYPNRVPDTDELFAALEKLTGADRPERLKGA